MAFIQEARHALARLITPDRYAQTQIGLVHTLLRESSNEITAREIVAAVRLGVRSIVGANGQRDVILATNSVTERKPVAFHGMPSGSVEQQVTIVDFDKPIEVRPHSNINRGRVGFTVGPENKIWKVHGHFFGLHSFYDASGREIVDAYVVQILKAKGLRLHDQEIENDAAIRRVAHFLAHETLDKLIAERASRRSQRTQTITD